jgi:hypothetical protein
MRQVVLIVIFVARFTGTYAQILDNSLFRIYRASFIHGAVTHLRIDKEATYEIAIAEFHCSLCDHDELIASINSNGSWFQCNDTIHLISEDEKSLSFLILNDSLLRPTYPIGWDLDLAPDSIKKKIITSIQSGGAQDFHLVYDTYPNGVARFIIDRYRMRLNEYEIEFKPNGSIKFVDYYWDGKKRKWIR